VFAINSNVDLLLPDISLLTLLVGEYEGHPACENLFHFAFGRAGLP